MSACFAETYADTPCDAYWLEILPTLTIEPPSLITFVSSYQTMECTDNIDIDKLRKVIGIEVRDWEDFALLDSFTVNQR